MENKNNKNNCKCNTAEKEICCKMQLAGLRNSISCIEDIKNGKDIKNGSYPSKTAILNILGDIASSLQIYQCFPGRCLISRIKNVIKRINRSKIEILTVSEEAMLESVINELNCFIKNME